MSHVKELKEGQIFRGIFLNSAGWPDSWSIKNLPPGMHRDMRGQD